jgi:hypothetical protein
LLAFSSSTFTFRRQDFTLQQSNASKHRRGNVVALLHNPVQQHDLQTRKEHAKDANGVLHASQFKQPVAESLRVRRPKKVAALSEGGEQRRNFCARRL